MNLREIYIASLKFGKQDKVFFSPGGPRESTLKRWYSEGLATDKKWFDVLTDTIGIELPKPKEFYIPNVSTKMIPTFEEKVLKHENGHYIVQDWMGAITEISDEFDYTYIRQARDFVTRKWHKFPVETTKDWQDMQKRFTTDEKRFDPLLKEKGKLADEREYPITISFNGPFWQIREWMGFEGLCIAMIERPDFVMDMANFWREFMTNVLTETFKYFVPDKILINEDMAYKAHSMISPKMARYFLQPSYIEWVNLAKSNGVPLVEMDSDGYIADLIPIWIESGIESCSPMEVAAHNDIVEYRKIYGDKMAFAGGIDKRAIAKGGKVIEAELDRIAPLLETGGFIPGCDHGVPHDISWPNFLHYTKILARMTGWL